MFNAASLGEFLPTISIVFLTLNSFIHSMNYPQISFPFIHQRNISMTRPITDLKAVKPLPSLLTGQSSKKPGMHTSNG
jgi:hypothetical protein